MPKVSICISEELLEKAKKELKKIKGKNHLVVKKLEAIIAAYSCGSEKVAEVYGVTRETLCSWVNHFQKSGVEKLKAPSERRRKTILSDSDRAVVKKLVEEDSQITLKVLGQKVFELCGKKISKSSLHRELGKVGFAHVKPRPQHYKQDLKQVEEFKKKSMKS